LIGRPVGNKGPRQARKKKRRGEDGKDRDGVQRKRKTVTFRHDSKNRPDVGRWEERARLCVNRQLQARIQQKKRGGGNLLGRRGAEETARKNHIPHNQARDGKKVLIHGWGNL